MFVLCMFGECPGLGNVCHSWKHTGVVHVSVQADGKVAFEDIRCFEYDAQPAVILRCISLSCYFSVYTLLTLIGLLYTTTTFAFAMFIFRLIRLLSSDILEAAAVLSVGAQHRPVAPRPKASPSGRHVFEVV